MTKTKKFESVWDYPSEVFVRAAEIKDASHYGGVCFNLAEALEEMGLGHLHARFAYDHVADLCAPGANRDYSAMTEAWGSYGAGDNSEPRILWLLLMAEAVKKPRKRK